MTPHLLHRLGSQSTSVARFSAPGKRRPIDSWTRRLGAISVATALALAAASGGPDNAIQAQSGCAAAVNPIACENLKQGNPASQWDVSGAGDASIQGFATDISVARGQTQQFKIKTTSTNYTIDIYRMGSYGGSGARKIATIAPSAPLPQTQPNCLSNSPTGLIDCGNWAVSASWVIPPDAVSGIYFAKLTRVDTGGGASHIVFVVRDDTGRSDLLFQTSDTTWQAYNSYGGNSLYQGSPAGRAYKVSYNRPFNTRGVAPEDWVFNAEYPLVRWLEANGYNVSYITGVDSDRFGAELLEHKVFLSVGHDEYWSGAQRANVEAARAAGVHLAFFSGNEVFWKTRWETSIDASGTPYRTLVSYKETHANAKIDTNPAWTGTWRDPRFSPPADGGRPENALTGTVFEVNAGTGSIRVPSAHGKHRFWRGTTIANLATGASATLPTGTLGYEWDEAPNDAFTPQGLMRLSLTTMDAEILLDYGSTYGFGPATHSLTLYRHASGALAFGAGTVQWSWGLDANHDRGSTSADVRMKQATVNLFADMGVQPDTIELGLVTATESSDITPPTSTISSPTTGQSFAAGTPITISGTASDGGGGIVTGVEVSVNGGASWERATGTTNWTFPWSVSGTTTATILSRAFDDTGNNETPSAGVTITVTGAGGSCPCTIWSPSAVPPDPDDDDPAAVEIGTKFRADSAGQVTGVRFYKAVLNTGTHVGKLWSRTGSLLASATFTGETASGWQHANFATPVAIAANTTYVVSYHAPNGHYTGTDGFFETSLDRPPLHGLRDGVDGPNGVYRYGASGFPTDTYLSEGYWVDVVFQPGADTTPPAVTTVSPPPGSSGVQTSASPTATFNEAMTAASINSSSFLLNDPSNALVSATVTYNSGTMTATLTPSSPLASSTQYTAVVKGGSVDPRVKDVAGNAMTGDYIWSFTTAAPPPPPPTEGPGGPVLVVTSTTNLFTTYYAEILRNEGLNAFTTQNLNLVSAATLANYDVVILGEMPLTAAQVTMFSNWVTSGGNLIAMRPDKQLAGLLGLTDAAATLSNAYLLVNTAAAPGTGIVNQTMQFHGTADRYSLNGASSIATLYSNATTATANPAVTMRQVGAGTAVAFAYDLARSVVQTRQGNPAWSGQERDGFPPIRSDDLFFGARTGDVQPDWVNLSKVAIPQADEQQRFLWNIILHANADRKPLARFWYLPRMLKGVVVMTGDDHANGGTAGRFDKYITSSPPGCSVDDWECVRGTSYIYPGTPIGDGAAANYVAQGFEIGLHVNTNCANYTPATIAQFYTAQLSEFAAGWPSVPAPTTNRTHCIVFSDYATQPQVELNSGIRFDTNYYYWPGSWVNNRPGLFTGSGLPMRFTTATGQMIDVYQAATQITDESQQDYELHIESLLDRAIGPEGYYVAVTANMHTDANPSEGSIGSDIIVAAAQARGIPVITAKQMLDWLDGRNGSSFQSITWSGSQLGFDIAVGAGAQGLSALVPASANGEAVVAISANATPVSFTTQTIKGVSYAVFPAQSLTYQVTYGVGDPVPSITISDAVVTEGHSGIAHAVFDVTLSGASESTVTVNFATADGTAVAGGDYAVTSGTVTFAPGVTAQTISVPALGDTLNEADELLFVNLSAPANASIAKAQGALMIVNDDPVPALAIGDGSITEGNTGTTTAGLTVNLDMASGQVVTVAYATADGTATAGSDFNATSGTLTFAPGVVSQTIAVGVRGDVIDEPSETVLVNLSNPAKATITRSQGTLTILDNDLTAFTDTTVADFTAGSPDAAIYIGDSSGGDVMLKPIVGAEFSGTTLPTGWTSATWATGGVATVGSGNVTVNGTRVRTTALYGPGRSLEFAATFSGAADQNVGFGVDFNTQPWAAFGTTTSGVLRARSRNGTSQTNTTISGSWFTAPHRFRIDWNASTIVFFIDGVQVASHSRSITAQMRPMASDRAVGGGSVTVNWMRMTPYATPATFLSRVINAGSLVPWSNVSWTSVLPPGTSLVVSVRTGATAVPDASWTSFATIPSPGASIGASSQYLQYRVQLATTVIGQTPTVMEITVGYNRF